jgi:hypothetical protein
LPAFWDAASSSSPPFAVSVSLVRIGAAEEESRGRAKIFGSFSGDAGLHRERASPTVEASRLVPS